jgi:hypothetical protein
MIFDSSSPNLILGLIKPSKDCQGLPNADFDSLKESITSKVSNVSSPKFNKTSLKLLISSLLNSQLDPSINAEEGCLETQSSEIPPATINSPSLENQLPKDGSLLCTDTIKAAANSPSVEIIMSEIPPDVETDYDNASTVCLENQSECDIEHELIGIEIQSKTTPFDIYQKQTNFGAKFDIYNHFDKENLGNVNSNSLDQVSALKKSVKRSNLTVSMRFLIKTISKIASVKLLISRVHLIRMDGQAMMYPNV